ncbi:Uncharacterised protein [Nocardia farcinica]|uniref:ESX-1 secretion-associated protein n=1 Tax=Nocardia farcinica TaxID=37329 RepID=A0A449GDG7_NOCFR|nr:hypothetical protein CRM89_06205 [Nocardia sp. FDAARGOS_372]VFA95996.1 Uncharacterised protein [Nocardia farcinica]
MPPRPTAERIKVATDNLRAESRVWTTESGTLTSISHAISRLKFNRTEAGMFQLIVTAHSNLVDKAAERCQEGSTAFADTGSTLNKVANTYDEEDRLYAERLANIW